MSQLSHMLKFLNRLKNAEGEERQKLAEVNKALLRTDLAQKAAKQRVTLYEQHVRRLETALKLLRAEQETHDDAESEAGADEGA